MNIRIRIGLYLLLGLVTVILGSHFQQTYSRMYGEAGQESQTDPTDMRVPINAKARTPDKDFSRLIGYFGGFVACLIFLGLLVARDISLFTGAKAVQSLFNDEGEGIKDPEYEQAEEAWANGHHLEAIQMMREYLKKYPRQQHAALRIAEIYEKDLQNYLAAALEYEEVLKQKLAAEQWGWAAIHLCNLYSSKLNQPDKAVALLRRIDAEYTDTAAAEKARKRLALFDAMGTEGLREESTPAGS